MKKRDRQRLQRHATKSISPPAAPRRRRWLALGLASAAILASAAVGAMLWLGSTATTLAASGSPAATTETSGVSYNGKTYTNRLIHSHDPYLLLHAHNPVDWYPWGPEALAAAKRENKPIFLSVGYSTCYWCHVAEREIYSNPDIAKLMNQRFINIKVDREQRPDVDRVYMLATQMMTGGGGWPNNVFLTPDLKPFYAGSYFPPKDEGGRPGFPTILVSLSHAWSSDRAKVIDVGARVYQALQQAERQLVADSGTPLAAAQWLEQAVQQAAADFDGRDAGFSGGGATKFPREPLLWLLLADAARAQNARALNMVTATLQAMAEGGMMDQLAGGFHRYSTDPEWNVPHFEKMLYDNAQLLGLYARAYALTRQPLFKQVALRTAHYLVAEMRSPDGGFYSAQDSQIDGVEGVSYVWTKAQIESVLGTADAQRFFALYSLTPMPQSFAGQKQSPGGVLRLDRDVADKLAAKHALAARLDALAPLRDKLLAARDRRPQPDRDEKIVTADNALAILGFLEAGQALGDPALTRTAVDTADWEWARAFDPKTGRLRHQFFHGHAGDAGFLDDYALLGQALLTLRTATGDGAWQTRAQQLADAMLQRFARPDGQLASTTDSTDLLVAPPAEGDAVQPSGQSAAVALLLGLSAAGGDARYAAAARRALAPLSAQIAAGPSGWGAMVAAINQPSFVALLQQPGQGSSVAAGLPSSADHVHAHARLTASGVLLVTVDIDAGYHINANPASDPALIPTQLTLDGQSALQVDYPQPQIFKPAFASQGLAVYTGQVALQARLPAGQAAPLKAALRVQACNDQYCLAPATLKLTVAASR
ncbi:MAG: thioredoxin domain-containing protein [Gammaproteobacteria bacterium]|nr:thioredoxin domain-containing protein [Gammaproteobacteria bacterium]